MEIRCCTEEDREDILAYIGKEPEMNLFFYGDIEEFGVSSPEMRLYVFGDWDSLVMDFHGYFNVYSQRDEFDALSVVSFLEGQKAVYGINGKEDVIKKIGFFTPLEMRITHLCALHKVNDAFLRPLEDGTVIKKLSVDDLGEVSTLLGTIEEFRPSYRDADGLSRQKKIMEESLEHGTLLYGAVKAGRIVSTAGTTAASAMSAMVTNVATEKNERGNGYASFVVTALCKASLEEGKKFLCLGFNNPKAGSIYHKMGFSEVGNYILSSPAKR